MGGAPAMTKGLSSPARPFANFWSGPRAVEAYNLGDTMGRLLIIAAILGASVIVLAGYSWAETCQTCVPCCTS